MLARGKLNSTETLITSVTKNALRSSMKKRNKEDWLKTMRLMKSDAEKDKAMKEDKWIRTNKIIMHNDGNASSYFL